MDSQLCPTLAEQLTAFLQENADVFAWISNDLIGIDPSIAVHSLNIDPAFPLVKQKKRYFGPEKDKIIHEEVRATYQRLVDRMFREQLGRNIEVYIDDMLVKSKQMDQHLADLADTFDALKKYHMKLNPAKCAFGALRKAKDFIWDEEYQQAFQELKTYLAQLPLLTKPMVLPHLLAAELEQFTSPEGDELKYGLCFDFKALNNEVKYEALIVGIRMALDVGARSLIVYFDSQLVTKQVRANKKSKRKE
ncbi:UNVERIFIED_CONTAM: hypothetical protein Slati_1726300 [Sesamum latifolium]|uniref:Uncharacterized protein n=1 Tax=Sesamum latifolium TaxID=2727402 RepID=A0AAW2WVA6_9LAMI